MDKVGFVSKNENAPNVPQAKGIEMFWTLRKQEYSKPTNTHNDPVGFRMVMGNIIKSVEAKSGKAVMDSACYQSVTKVWMGLSLFNLCFIMYKLLLLLKFGQFELELI